MFEKKKLWMMLATTALVAACGGGSGGGGAAPGDGTNPPGDNPPASNDTALNGYALMEPNNHLAFNDTFQTMSSFQDGGIYGQAEGPNSAPLQKFGFRIMDNIRSADDTALEGNDEATGRLGISFTERDDSAATGEVTERMQIIVNGVRLTTDAGNILSAEVTDGATMIVAGRTAANDSVGPVEVAIPTTAVRVSPDTEFGGGSAGGGDAVLVFDLAEAFGAATGDNATQLQQLADIAGRFDMNVTVSAVEIRTGDGTTTTELVGEPVTVDGSGAPAVEGSGVSGNIWIGELPPGV